MRHGGDIYNNKVNMDFSVNVNPLGIPDEIKTALEKALSECMNYPDINSDELSKRMSEFFGVRREGLIFGNGASELFVAIVNGLRPKGVLIPVPTFCGYEYAAVNADIMYYEMSEDNGFALDGAFLDKLTDVDMVFLCNPNNPTGLTIDKELLADIITTCDSKDITVVLDESFSFFCGEDISLSHRVDEYKNLVIVKSLTKIFAIPGVRLGVAICGDEKKRERIGSALPEWNLSVFAQRAGEAGAGLKGFISDTVGIVKKERDYLCGALEKRGFGVILGEANYLLFYSEMALYDELLKRGVLIRDCADFKGLKDGFYRIAVRGHDENRSLMKMIDDILGAEAVK